MKSHYGNNVEQLLRELAAFSPEDLDNGFFEVYGEDVEGQECSCQIDVTKLAEDALALIEHMRYHIEVYSEALRYNNDIHR